MVDMCKYNMTSQQNSTTQSIYLKGYEESYIVRITIMGHMTQHTEHTSNGSITCLSTENYK